MKCSNCIHDGICYMPYNDYVSKKELENCKYFEQRLPCRVGDNIYFEVSGYDRYHTYKQFIQCQKVIEIVIREEGTVFKTASMQFCTQDFGKKVFTTKKEATQKLGWQ